MTYTTGLSYRTYLKWRLASHLSLITDYLSPSRGLAPQQLAVSGPRQTGHSGEALWNFSPIKSIGQSLS
jgi:hypothetical protein